METTSGLLRPGSNEGYWNWGYQMDEWWWRENMLADYNIMFEYEVVGKCKPDGDDNQASTEYSPMWTGWKVDWEDTYSHDNGACAANYWGSPTRGKEKFASDISRREIVCSDVEDKYEAECEYGLVMGSYDDYDWHTEALWYTEAYGEKSFTLTSIGFAGEKAALPAATAVPTLTLMRVAATTSQALLTGRPSTSAAPCAESSMRRCHVSRVKQRMIIYPRCGPRKASPVFRGR